MPILRFNDFQAINESNNNPTNKKLWDKAIRLAKGTKNGGSSYVTVDGKKYDAPNDGKGYDEYPSAYANSYAAKMYKKWGGSWKTNEAVEVVDVKLEDLIGMKNIMFIHTNAETSSLEPLSESELEKHIDMYSSEFIDMDFALNSEFGEEYIDWFNENKRDYTKELVLDNIKIQRRRLMSNAYKVSLDIDKDVIEAKIIEIMLDAPKNVLDEYVEYRKQYTGEDILNEDLREWHKEEWVRINTSGDITGECGTMKDKDAPTRCLPKKKAQSLTKAERKATVAKKKEAGKKGKQFVSNTKKAKVKK